MQTRGKKIDFHAMIACSLGNLPRRRNAQKGNHETSKTYFEARRIIAARKVGRPLEYSLQHMLTGLGLNTNSLQNVIYVIHDGDSCKRCSINSTGSVLNLWNFNFNGPVSCKMWQLNDTARNVKSQPHL